MDWLLYAVMGLFALLMFWIAFDDRIHTGLFGTVGAGGAGVQSLRIMDDSVLHTVQGTQSAILLFVACITCLVANVMYTMWRAGVFDGATAEEADDEGGVQPAAASSMTPR
ncbi:MAG: hypothetical protein ACRC1H_06890, partial [Caldilineaceae bacterium]